MTEEDWLAVVARIASHQPLDLDQTVFHALVRPVPGGAFTGPRDDPLPPSSRLWDRDEASGSFMGVRVTAPLPDCATTALRLAAVAVERQVIPIILSTLPDSGFEQFGFRVERLLGGTPEQLLAAEEDLSRFWNLAIIVDAADVALLG